MSKSANEVTPSPDDALKASVQVLPLPPGLYLFSVSSASPSPSRIAADLQLPAVSVAPGPGTDAGQIEFLSGARATGAWLFTRGDLLVARISGGLVSLVLTSVRAAGGAALAIKVERLDSRADAAPIGSAAAAQVPVVYPVTDRPRAPRLVATNPDALPVRIGTHIRARGDMTFTDSDWAGKVAPGLWVESFSLLPLERFTAQDIEYKGLTGSGFETPWLSDDKPCGTKGMAVPLVGFAVRVKPRSATADYDCEYSGYFQSGITVGPIRNGAPCRSTVANDPLEGIQLRLVKKRGGKAEATAEGKPARGSKVTRRL